LDKSTEDGKAAIQTGIQYAGFLFGCFLFCGAVLKGSDPFSVVKDKVIRCFLYIRIFGKMSRLLEGRGV
jgi:hypothetical protein